MFKEFREFATRGNVVDLAIGIMIGGAFAPIAASLVGDILMPPIGLVLGGADFTDLFLTLREGTPGGPYASLVNATEAGAVTVNYGRFLNTLLTFLIITFAAFMIVKAVNRLQRKQEAAATTRPCPFCVSEVPLQATRCPACTSELAASTPAA